MLKTTSATLDRGARWIVVVVLAATTTLGPTSLPSVRAHIPGPAASILATTPAATATATITAPTETAAVEVTAPPSETATWTPEPPASSTPVSGYPGLPTETPPPDATPIATGTVALRATATPTADDALEAEIPVTGGEVIYGEKGELKLKFPDQAVKTLVKVRVKQLKQLPKDLPLGVWSVNYGVDVDLRAASDNAKVEALDRPAQVVLRYADLFPDLDEPSQKLLALYHYDEKRQAWERLNTEVSLATGVLTATVTGFSPVTLVQGTRTTEGDYARPWQPVMPRYSIDTFSGALNWRIPIEAPAGRGGLAPDLALSYSSAAVDELHGDANPQPSGIGLGWSLSVPYIERVVQWNPGNTYSTPYAKRSAYR